MQFPTKKIYVLRKVVYFDRWCIIQCLARGFFDKGVQLLEVHAGNIVHQQCVAHVRREYGIKHQLPSSVWNHVQSA